MVKELNNWKEALSVQKDQRFGAIPSGFEWMIRFNKIENINYETFQDDFNLKVKNEAENNFSNVADAVEKKYPQIKINIKTFDEGVKKIEFMQDLLENNIPCMMSLRISRKTNICHEMLLINSDDFYTRFIWRVIDSKNPDIFRIENLEIIDRNNNWVGGKEVAWIDPILSP